MAANLLASEVDIMKLSIVTTLYQSANHIEEFHVRTSASAIQLAGDDYEIIMVNDGSPDHSLEVAVALSAKDAHVTVIDLSRNFGHHKAMMAGLKHARGEFVFLIDSDLEEEPEWLLIFSEKMKFHQRQSFPEGCDVIYGVQESRKGSWFERVSGGIYYALLNIMTGLSLPKNIVTARLMTSRYVAALLQHQEREMVISGLWQITGFAQCACTIKKYSLSQTTYSFRKKIDVLINSIVAFSGFPLLCIFYLGVLVSFLSFLFFVYFVGRWVLMEEIPDGWTSIIVSIWLIGGLVVLFVGLVGIYVSKIFSEVKCRPYVIVRNIYKGNN